MTAPTWLFFQASSGEHNLQGEKIIVKQSLAFMVKIDEVTERYAEEEALEGKTKHTKKYGLL